MQEQVLLTRSLPTITGEIGESTCLNSLHRRFPVRTAIVGELDAHDDLRVLPGDESCQLRIHIYEILLDVSVHAFTNDVEKREDLCPRPLDSLLLERLKIAPAGTSGIHHRCDTGPEEECIRLQTCAAVAVTSPTCSPEDMYILHTARNSVFSKVWKRGVSKVSNSDL